MYNFKKHLRMHKNQVAGHSAFFLLVAECIISYCCQVLHNVGYDVLTLVVIFVFSHGLYVNSSFYHHLLILILLYVLTAH